MKKFAFIGAGSFIFTRNLVRDLLSFPDFADCELALMDTDESESGERLVLLENMSSDTWVVGERYRIYADAYGVYDGKPRLVGRYTYDPR